MYAYTYTRIHASVKAPHLHFFSTYVSPALPVCTIIILRPPMHKTEEAKLAADQERCRCHYEKDSILKRRRELRLAEPSQEIQEIKKELAIALGYDEDETGTISEPETGEDENDALTDLPSCLLALKSIKDEMLVLIQEPCTFTEGLLLRSSDSLPCQHWPGHIPLFSNVEQDYGNLFGIFLADTGTGLFPMSSKTGNFFCSISTFERTQPILTISPPDSVHMPPATVPFFIERVFTSSPLQQCIFINSAPSTARPELTVIRQNHPSFESVARSMADESVLHVYKSVFYNIPAQVKPSQSIFYVTRGTHIGVVAGWENALNCVMGVPGAAYFKVDSIAIGEEKIRAAIDEGCVEMVEPWVTSDY
ncbi:hypothetical protein C8R48DRAFT_776946 [Suillus tomentosus]|nr:hypothetical protein C8R48DRAFT_776946 [Suillus tomentosus]